MTNTTVREQDQDERQLAELIRQGGTRMQPSAMTRQAVRAAVHAEWQAVIAERARRRRSRWSLAAAAGVAGVTAWLALPMMQAPAVTVASIARVTGPVEISGAGWSSRPAGARAGDAVVAGSEIRSGAGGRVALQIGAVSLRLDQHSTLTLVAADRVELRRGAVYLDSGSDDTRAASLRVATAFGTVEHLGTQYETRLLGDGLRVRVREGIVRIASDGKFLDGGAGQQLTVLGGGAVRRAAVMRAGEEWAWVGEIAPRYELENRSLAEFLRWVGRETGREVAYESAAAQAEARRVMLRGSTAGLSPERAMAAVLSTTRLGYDERPDQLIIAFRTGEMN